MPELYSEYDGLAEKWATPLHTTSGLTEKLTRQACLQLSLPSQNHHRYPTRRNLPQAKPGRVQRGLGGLTPILLIRDQPQSRVPCLAEVPVLRLAHPSTIILRVRYSS